MTGRKTYNFPHRQRPRQRRQTSPPLALPQGGLLNTLTIYVLVEAVQRFREPEGVQSTGMLIVAAIGLAVIMAITLCYL